MGPNQVRPLCTRMDQGGMVMKGTPYSQSGSITEASLSDGLVSYLGHSSWKQLVYSTAYADMEHEGNCDTNCNWRARKNPQMHRNKQRSRDYLKYSIIETGHNTEKRSGDLRRLVIKHHSETIGSRWWKKKTRRVINDNYYVQKQEED